MERKCVAKRDLVYHLHPSLGVGWGSLFSMYDIKWVHIKVFSECLAYKVYIWEGIVPLRFVGINKVL